MDDKQFEEITASLDMVIRLLALSLVKEKKSQAAKILALDSFGFAPVEISELVKTSQNVVNVTLSKARKRKAKKKTK